MENEVYDIIRKMRPDIKVLFVSGYGEEVISKTGISKEGLNFIRKTHFRNRTYRKSQMHYG